MLSLLMKIAVALRENQSVVSFIPMFSSLICPMVLNVSALKFPPADPPAPAPFEWDRKVLESPWESYLSIESEVE